MLRCSFCYSAHKPPIAPAISQCAVGLRRSRGRLCVVCSDGSLHSTVSLAWTFFHETGCHPVALAASAIAAFGNRQSRMQLAVREQPPRGDSQKAMCHSELPTTSATTRQASIDSETKAPALRPPHVRRMSCISSEQDSLCAASLCIPIAPRS